MYNIMRISQKGLEFIKSFEGYSSVAYPDPGTGGKPYTIGYGTTKYPDGRSVKLGDTCTVEQASGWLFIDVSRVVAQIGELPLNQHQADAVISFVYNLGIGNFNKSTLRRKILKNPLDPTIPDEFLKWNKAAGRIMAGLTRRRKAEAEMYKGG